MRRLGEYFKLIVVAVIINVALGFGIGFLLDRYDELGLIGSIVILIIYFIVMWRSFLDCFLDNLFFDKLLRTYLLMIMPAMTFGYYFLYFS